jgi:hypothetical protein
VLHNDGTASINSGYGIDKSFVERLKHSEVISDLDSIGAGGLTFNIKSIDSIGNYLAFHQAGFLNFSDYGDSIIVESGGNRPYHSEKDVRAHLEILIKTDEEYEAYDANGNLIKPKRSKHYSGISLFQNRWNQEKGKKNIYAILKKKN